jgi:hypothetical protein
VGCKFITHGEMQNENCKFLIESCTFFDSGSTQVPSLTFIWTSNGHNISVAGVKLFGFYHLKKETVGSATLWCIIVTVLEVQINVSTVF